MHHDPNRGIRNGDPDRLGDPHAGADQAALFLGAITGAPSSLVQATPFAHIGFVPTQPFRMAAASVMLAVGALATIAALLLCRRRDLTGG